MNRLAGFMARVVQSLHDCADPKPERCCSFCGASYRDVGPLVEGPRLVFICGDCVDLCRSIIDQEQARRLGLKFAAAGSAALNAAHDRMSENALKPDFAEEEPAAEQPLTDYGRIAEKVAKNRVSFAALRPRPEEGIDVSGKIASRYPTVVLLCVIGGFSLLAAAATFLVLAASGLVQSSR